MKSNFDKINALSYGIVAELNERILSGKYSPAELSAWLESQGVTLAFPILGLHAKQVRNAAGLSTELQRRLLSGTDGQSTDAIHQELGDLGQVAKLCRQRIRQLEQTLISRAKQSHRPPAKPPVPYADPTAPKATQ